MVYQEKINHFGHPVMRWMMSNVEIRTDPAGNIKIMKGDTDAKCDGIVSLVMALGSMMAGEPPPRSRYEDNPELDMIHFKM